MKRQSTYGQSGSLRSIFYALGFMILIGIGFLMVHDIQVPTEHITQDVSVNIDN